MLAVCVIWTSITNDNTCIKYLESVLWATFDRNIVQYCTWYNHSIQIRYNTHWHMHFECVFHIPKCNLYQKRAARTWRLLGPFKCAVHVFKCLAQAHSNDNPGRCQEVRPFDQELSLLTFALRH